jgi:hypothetical protein
VAAQDTVVDTLSADGVKVDTSYVENEATVDTTTVDSIVFRSVPDTTIARLKSSKEFEYANDPAYWKRKEEEVSGEDSNSNFDPFQALRYLFVIVFIVVLVYAVWQILFQNKIVIFKRKKKFSSNEVEGEDAAQEDLPALISQAEHDSDFRLASRYRYLLLLQDLHARQLIRMHSELTNWDYVNQLGSNPLNDRFRFLTIAYDYIWYGEFQPSAQQYESLKKKFESFLH